MRIALISDIHSNIQALDATLDFVDAAGADEVFCLGDIVGYGADPEACIHRVRARCAAVVLGNHDLAVVSEPHRRHLPRDGKKAAKHNRAALSDEDVSFLRTLPYTEHRHGATIVHATPQNPEHWIRLNTLQLTQAQFEAFEGAICFSGHTHRPAVISNKLGVHRVRPGHRFLVNVGSVGQPRDGNPRACVGLFDTDDFSYELHRVDYDIEAAVERIRAEGLPEGLGERLKHGR